MGRTHTAPPVCGHVHSANRARYGSARSTGPVEALRQDGFGQASKEVLAAQPKVPLRIEIDAERHEDRRKVVLTRSCMQDSLHIAPDGRRRSCRKSLEGVVEMTGRGASTGRRRATRSAPGPPASPAGPRPRRAARTVGFPTARASKAAEWSRSRSRHSRCGRGRPVEPGGYSSWATRLSASGRSCVGRSAPGPRRRHPPDWRIPHRMLRTASDLVDARLAHATSTSRDSQWTKRFSPNDLARQTVASGRPPTGPGRMLGR